MHLYTIILFVNTWFISIRIRVTRGGYYKQISGLQAQDQREVSPSGVSPRHVPRVWSESNTQWSVNKYLFRE